MSGHTERNALDLDQFRLLLDEERERYESIVKGISEAGLDQSMTESTGELSSLDQHAADSGNEMYEREKDLGLRADALDTLGRIEAAMLRIESGEYGVCRSCGRPIGVERLKAIPFAEECVACAGEHGVESYQRPIEERAASFVESFSDSDDETAYDAEDAWQDVARFGTANSPQDVIGAVEYDEVYIHADEDRGAADDMDRIIADLDEDQDEEKERARDDWI